MRRQTWAKYQAQWLSIDLLASKAYACLGVMPEPEGAHPSRKQSCLTANNTCVPQLNLTGYDTRLQDSYMGMII